MEEILDAPVQAERTFNYAGFWIRFAAYIIDYIILWLGFFIIGFFIGEDSLSLGFLIIIVAIFYFPAMESSARQATIGKMAVGIKVVNLKGEPISFGNALGRFFAKIISGLILYVGFMMAGWDPKKQALHDRLADTYVVYNN